MSTEIHIGQLKDEAEKLLNLSLEKSTDIIAIFDPELNYLYANNAACELLGKSKDQLQNRNLLHLFPQLTASVSHRHLLTALTGETVLEVPSEGNITKNGAQFLSNYYPLIKHNKIHCVIAVTKKLYYPL